MKKIYELIFIILICKVGNTTQLTRDDIQLNDDAISSKNIVIDSPKSYTLSRPEGYNGLPLDYFYRPQKLTEETLIQYKTLHQQLLKTQSLDVEILCQAIKSDKVEKIYIDRNFFDLQNIDNSSLLIDAIKDSNVHKLFFYGSSLKTDDIKKLKHSPIEALGFNSCYINGSDDFISFIKNLPLSLNYLNLKDFEFKDRYNFNSEFYGFIDHFTSSQSKLKYLELSMLAVDLLHIDYLFAKLDQMKNQNIEIHFDTINLWGTKIDEQLTDQLKEQYKTKFKNNFGINLDFNNDERILVNGQVIEKSHK